MDVVYVCRPGQRNDELRYSLRSLANLAHDRVWIGGSCPAWVQGVQQVPVAHRRSKYEASTANLMAVAAAGVSARFVLMNDDFFLMQPLEEVPVLHRGPIADAVPDHPTLSYARRMAEMADWLKLHGHTQLCYEMHAPMVLERRRLLEVMNLPVEPAVRDRHKRTLYGNVWALGGERVDDFKISTQRQGFSPETPFLSTTDNSFRLCAVGKHIRERFPDPSPYERVM